MQILKKILLIVMTVIFILSAVVPVYAAVPDAPEIKDIAVKAVDTGNGMQEKYLFHVPFGVTFRGGTGLLEVPAEDNIAPGIGMGFELMHAYPNGLCPSMRFDVYGAFYPMYPDGWKGFSGQLMTDLSFDWRVMLHIRPKNIGEHGDLYFGAGLEVSLFNPYSNQNEVQAAFGHEYSIFGIFNEGFGFTAVGGVAFDFPGDNRTGYSLFAEGEMRNLTPGHMFFSLRLGTRYTL